MLIPFVKPENVFSVLCKGIHIHLSGCMTRGSARGNARQDEASEMVATIYSDIRKLFNDEVWCPLSVIEAPSLPALPFALVCPDFDSICIEEKSITRANFQVYYIGCMRVEIREYEKEGMPVRSTEYSVPTRVLRSFVGILVQLGD